MQNISSLYSMSIERKSHFHQANMLLFLPLLHWTTLNSSQKRRLKEKQGENLIQLKKSKIGRHLVWVLIG